KAVGGFRAQAANLDQIVTITCRFKKLLLLLDGPVRQGIALVLIKRHKLRLARLRHRIARDQLGDRGGGLCRRAPKARGVSDNEGVAAKSLAGEEQAARKTKRSIEVVVERGVKAHEVDAELAHEILGRRAVQGLWRLHRCAAAVADDPAAAEREFVAFGMTAEIVMIVEDEDTGLGPDRVSVEPRRGEPADAAADYHQI